eukprot:4529620-Prymnesium_polylepis.1
MRRRLGVGVTRRGDWVRGTRHAARGGARRVGGGAQSSARSGVPRARARRTRAGCARWRGPPSRACRPHDAARATRARVEGVVGVKRSGVEGVGVRLHACERHTCVRQAGGRAYAASVHRLMRRACV